MTTQTIDHTVAPVVTLENEIECIAVRLSEMPDNDVIAFLERLVSKMRVRRAVERHSAVEAKN